MKKRGRNSAKRERFREMYRDRLRSIEQGKENPETDKEWAIWHRGVTSRNARKLKDLHDNAAINKPSSTAGLIVVVPPKSTLG